MDVRLREDAFDGAVLGGEAAIPARVLLEDLDRVADLQGQAEARVALPVVDRCERKKRRR